MQTNAGFRPQEMQRRQFQQATATAIDQHATILKDVMAALSKQALDAKASREFVADLAARLDRLERALIEGGQYARAIDRVMSEFMRRPVLGRLRWLFTGR